MFGSALVSLKTLRDIVREIIKINITYLSPVVPDGQEQTLLENKPAEQDPPFRQ